MKLLSRTTPRYTSYPTAPNFETGAGEELIDALIKNANSNGPASLYLHVPYCDRLCWFCGCHTKQIRRYEPVAKYVETLIGEMKLVRRSAGKPIRVSRIHWGGGSPSILRQAESVALRSALEENFLIADGAEVSVEVDPSDLENADISALVALGITRASIGVQDFDERVQSAINRPQSFESTKAAADRLRQAGVSSLNIDALYGLPHQTTNTLRRTTELINELRPDRIALFGYAHVPWLKKHQRLIPEDALPGIEERFAQAEAASTWFREFGYVAIGIDHFSLPGDELAKAMSEGRLRRNFQGYTTDCCDTLIGLGASAISRSPQAYVQNLPPTSLYQSKIEAGELAALKGKRLSLDDQIRALMIEDLMCNFSINVARLEEKFGDAANRYVEEMHMVANQRIPMLCRMTKTGLEMVEQMKPFVRLVAAEFDAYLTDQTQRFSKVV